MTEPEISVDFAAAQVEELTSLTAEQQAEKYQADPLNSGFLWYTPPMAYEDNPLSTDGQQWIISGHDMQVLSMTMPPGEQIVTEVGSFFFGSQDIKTDVEFTCCTSTNGGCSEGWGRICGGEACVKLLLKNDSPQQGFVGLTPTFPAKVIPLKVNS